MQGALNERVALSARSSNFHRLVESLEQAQDELCTRVLDSLGEEPFGGELRAILPDGLSAQLHSFRLELLPDRPPELVKAIARLAAVQGELGPARRIWRTVHMALWNGWLEAVDDGLGLDNEQRGDLLRRGSRFLFEYSDLVSDYFEDAYQQEVARISTSSDERKLHTVRELLNGNSGAASWLGLQLKRHHIGLVAWGDDPAAVLQQLAAELERHLFRVSCPPYSGVDCHWAWLSASEPLSTDGWARLQGFESSGSRIAFGFEAFEEKGFRSSHRQAIHARRLAPRGGPAAIGYADVAIEALACENEADARAFVAHELHGIDDQSVMSVRIRETLGAYFACEGNAASAAARLAVHQQTVANRLRAAEHRLGRPISARRIELETALRLRRCLAGG